MEFTLGLTEIGLGGLLFVVIIWLLRLLFTETVKNLIQKEHAKFLEDLKWEVKITRTSRPCCRIFGACKKL